jgi:hypothetical protein
MDALVHPLVVCWVPVGWVTDEYPPASVLTVGPATPSQVVH